jgi:hypothetical protein
MFQTIPLNGMIGVRGASGVGGGYQPTPLSVLNSVTTQEFFAGYKGRIHNAREFRLFDTRIVVAGQPILAKFHDFFHKVVGDDELTLDGTVTINKTRNMTNAEEANKLSVGTALIITSVQIRVEATVRDFGTITTGQPTSAVPAAAGTMAASNNLALLHRMNKFTCEIGQDMIAEGRLYDYPPKGGISGVLGAVDDEGVLQNGMGLPEYLDEVAILPGQQFFKVRLDAPIAVTYTQNIEIEYALCGTLVNIG